MRKLIYPVFMFVSLLSVAQTDTLTKDKLYSYDSIQQRNQQIRDSLLKIRELEEKERMDAGMKRNMDYILNLQKERKAKQKKAAIIRIAIGVGFFIILFIGLRKRRKK